MKIVANLNPSQKIKGNICLAAGFFDGVHLGHKKLLATLLKHSKQAKAQPWVLTFKEHPLRTLDSKYAPQLITSYEHKILILKKIGIKGCIVLDFSRRMANLSPEDFIKILLKKIPHLSEMVVGSNWTFGKNACGTAEVLKRLGKKYNFKVTVVPPVKIKHQLISSTLIRKLIAQGAIAEAEKMLGRPYSLFGEVVHGLGIGKKLGFPTANIEPFNEVFPPEGVYAGIAKLDNKFLKAAISIGKRPTITQKIKRNLHLEMEKNEKTPIIELHIFDKTFSKRSVYGKKIEVFFVKKIRDQQKFSSIELLKEAIKKDVAKADEILQQMSSKLTKRGLL